MEESPRYRPLYRQVSDYLVRQIADGSFRPGEALPSEQALAAKLGVSQGTVRKALDALAIDKLIERRQGKGTYVAEQTAERSLFRFFRLAAPGGARAIPTSDDDVLRRRGAQPLEAVKLQIGKGAPVIEIRRTRLVDGRAVAWEKIVVPQRLMPTLDRHQPLPNALYVIYQREYGLNITIADEELTADTAKGEDLRRLKVPAGTPLLQIGRVAIALDGTRVEWRVSRCDTRNHVYSVQLS